MSNVLIVYYSRTGATRRVAEELARIGDWELAPVIDLTPRAGLLGWARSLADALLGRGTELAPTREDPADFDVVVIGTPVWGRAVSSPIRSWLEERAGRLPVVAFFATESARGADRAFRQMAELARATPIATLALRTADARHEPIAPRLATLVTAIRAAVASAHPAAPPPQPGAGAPASH